MEPVDQLSGLPTSTSAMSAIAVAEAATARRRTRTARSFVASYGDGRVCSIAGCQTQLSRYNQATCCWTHAQPMTASARPTGTATG
jgi:hypothetical protein